MGFEMPPKDFFKKKNEAPNINDVTGSQIPENEVVQPAESNEKKPEQQIDYQKEFGLNDEQYKVLIELGKTEIKNWPPGLLERFDNLGVENMPKDGPEIAATVAGQIKEQKLEREQSPQEKQVTAEIAKEQKEISPGILSKLIPKRLKKAIGVGFASLSLFAAAGSFSNAEAGGPGHRPSFGSQLAREFQIGALKGVANAFDSTIEDMKARDRMARQFEQQAAQMEMNMYYQQRQMELSLRMQERQMEIQEKRMDRQEDRQFDRQERQAKARANEAARLKGGSNTTNPGITGTPSGEAF
jgi:hypothetical protein